MKRINEAMAAKDFMEKLRAGTYPLERAKNDGANYSDKKEDRDTQAVREFTRSTLFEEFKMV